MVEGFSGKAQRTYVLTTIMKVKVNISNFTMCSSSGKEGDNVRTPKPVKSVSEDLLEVAVSFHGHLGPFLALGLKAGLYAVEVLGKEPFETKAVVRTEPRPPRSCFVDGVQITTGCTMGKGNIALKDGEGLSILISRREKRLLLKVKADVLRAAEEVTSKNMERIALSILERSAQDLFEIEEATE